ncbi:MAG: glycosyltransferase family 2 protein [Christensenellales bacterium]
MPALVSVIIPVYNAQRCLGACLDSVLGQSYQHIEVILVNDGSKDDSLLLCRQYAAQDSRVRVVDQPNAGPGAARNAALKCATGEYLQFLDSDDLLPDGAILTLVEAMAGQDLVIGHFRICTPLGLFSDHGLVKTDRALDKAAFMQEHIKFPGSYYFSALWNKLYLRSIVETQDLRFDEGFIWGEDCLFNMRYYVFVKRAHFIPEVVYHYYRTAGGLSWGSFFNLHKGTTIKLKIYRALKALYRHEGLLERYRLRVWLYIFNVTLMD